MLENMNFSCKMQQISLGSWLKKYVIELNEFVLFDLILYIPSTIFQLYRDESSWVEPVLS